MERFEDLVKDLEMFVAPVEVKKLISGGYQAL